MLNKTVVPVMGEHDNKTKAWVRGIELPYDRKPVYQESSYKR